MADQHPTIDPYKLLNISLNPEGKSLTRLNPRPTVPYTSTQQTHQTRSTLYKDIPLNPATATFLRLFCPLNPLPEKKLPIIIYFHGGGFVLFSATSKNFHDTCATLAAQLPALIVSVEYRLAPEHRLPAAYEDAVEAIMWVRGQALGGNGNDPWMKEYANFSECYLHGDSSGGNIAYNAAIRTLSFDLSPMKFIGLILSQPFFGGVERTDSELRLMNNQMIPLVASDLLWDLALPIDADRDHEYCNPFLGGPHNDSIERLPRCLVRGWEGDPLIDRQMKFAKMLGSLGVHVLPKFRKGGFHAIEFFDSTKFECLFDDIKEFISS